VSRLPRTEQIDEAAACRDDAPYLEDAAGDATLTYAGLSRSGRAWTRHLDEAGIPAGARVAIRLPDPFGYARALVDVVAAGRVAVPLDPGAPAADVARMLKVAQPWALVGDDLESGLPVPGLPEPGLPGEDQLTHVAAAVAAHHRLTPADRGYCCLPLFHINAEVVGLLATLAAGACLVVDRKFSRRGFWELIGTRQITWINAVPAIITILAMDPPVASPERVAFCGRHDFDPMAELGRRVGPSARGIRPLPFAYVFGRSHFTVSYFGANVYPETSPSAWSSRPSAAGSPASSCSR
jgi:acyl-CoA synthetase (AMP-forming)/AMP-acid ligase II